MTSRALRVALAVLSLAALFTPAGSATAATGVDLQILDVTPQVNGRDVSWKVTVQNAGTSKSGKFLVEVFPHSAAAPAANVRGYPATWVPGGLKSGETKELTLGPVPRANGTFNAWAAIDGLGLVAEDDDANNVEGPVSYTVSAPAAGVPELFVSNLVLQWDSPTKLFYIVDIYNGGASTTAKFRTNLRYDSPDRSNPVYVLINGSTGQNVDNVEGLAAGATRTIKFYWDGVPDGQFTSWAYVDVPWDDKGDAVEEQDETNNLIGPILVLKNVVPTEETPDLVATDLRATVEGTTVTYEVDVLNDGFAPAGPFDVVVVPDSPGVPDLAATPPPATLSESVGGLAAGAQTTVVFEWTDAAPGAHPSWALVDPANQVAEASETNNTVGPVNVTVIEPVEGTDIALTDLRASVSGTKITYEVDVANGGLTALGPFDVVVVPDSAELPGRAAVTSSLSKTVDGLGPGEQTTVLLDWTGVPPGVYSSWALADPLDVLDEVNEGNNTQGPLEVKVEETGPVDGQDLVISGFDAATDENAVGYAVTVRNDGNVAAGPFTVALVLDSEETPPPGAAGDDSEVVDGLEPGASKKIIFVFEGLAEGIYKSWAIADSADQVAESDEDNNQAGPKAIYVQGPVAACVEGVQIIQPCKCGDEVLQSDWCCDGARSKSACVPDEPDTTGGGDGGGDDIAVFEPIQDEPADSSSEGGCAAAGSPFGPWAALAVLAALWVVRRRSIRAA